MKKVFLKIDGNRNDDSQTSFIVQYSRAKDNGFTIQKTEAKKSEKSFLGIVM